jgi:hypothetical protein
MPAGGRLATADVAFWQHSSPPAAAGDASVACTALSERARELNLGDWSRMERPTLPIVADGRTFAVIRPVPSTTITGGVAVVPPGWLGAIAVTLTLAIGIVVLLSRRRAIAQTTLLAAWWWTLAALLVWSLVEIAAALASPVANKAWLEPLRLAAVALSFCPVVALVGSKRPQHAAWNFVVLSLWGIVALPAAEAFFLNRGQRIAMGDARGWFLWILILLTPINLVPTRYWLAALFVAASQVLTLSPHLPLIRRVLVSHAELLGLALCVVALAIGWGFSRCERSTTNAYDRLWLDFRDSFGLFWGLRVQERINAAAQQQGWDLELTWSGFRRRNDGTPLTTIDAAIEPTLRTTFKGLLRRFVSHDWIAAQLGSPLD